jgi:hypothetical protein
MATANSSSSPVSPTAASTGSPMSPSKHWGPERTIIIHRDQNQVRHCCSNQGCGSGSRLDPDSVTSWIRIRIGNPDPGSGSRGKKIKKFQ